MRASLAALEGSPSLASESLDQAMADAEAAPAAPVPVEAPKPQKKRAPNRLVVEEAMNDDNSVSRLMLPGDPHEIPMGMDGWREGGL